MKTITAQELQTALQAEILEAENQYKIYEKVLEVLKPFEGKKISKRIETAFKKKYPENYCYFVNEHGMYYLNVCYTSEYDRNYLRFFLGSEKMSYSDKDESIISVESTETHRGFKFLSCYYGEANLKRIVAKKELLSNSQELERIVTLTNNLVTASKELREISIGPLGYIAQNLAGIERIPY